MELISMLFLIIALVFSVVVHEVAHGSAALAQGDPTAKFAGRLTLNPLKHLDWVGSVLVPAFLVIANSPFLFGWAKPVPVNPMNFRDKRWGDAKVAAAGAAANLALALIFGMILRFWPDVSGMAAMNFYALAQSVVIINLVLAVFNMIPIPPLDGSHVLFAFLPPSQNDFKIFLQKYGFVLLLILIFFFLPIIWPIVAFLYQIITGVPLF